MNRILPIWIILSFLIGVFGILKTYPFIEPDTEFLLFVDFAVLIFLVPSCALIFGSVLFILFTNIKSKSLFIMISILLLFAVIFYSISFLGQLYGMIGLIVFNGEFVLLVVLHFYILALMRYSILNSN